MVALASFTVRDVLEVLRPHRRPPRAVHLLAPRAEDQLNVRLLVLLLAVLPPHLQVRMLPLRVLVRQPVEHDCAPPHLRVPLRVLLALLPAVLFIEAPLFARQALKPQMERARVLRFRGQGDPLLNPFGYGGRAVVADP